MQNLISTIYNIYNLVKDGIQITIKIVLGVKKVYDSPDSEIQAKEGIKFKEKEVKKGWWNKLKSFVGKVIDIAGSPSMLKLMTLGCIGFLAFNPFGAIGIIVGTVVSVGCLVSGVIMDGSNLRGLKVQQKEALALEKLMELKKDKLQILANNPELAQALKDDIDKRAEIEGQGKTLKIKNILQHLPEATVPLVGNIMTGNPITIGVGIFCFMTNLVAGAAEQQSFNKQRNKMIDIVKKNKELLGLEFPAGKGLSFLKSKIQESHAELGALKKLEGNAANKNQTQIKEEFEKYKKEEMKEDRTQELKEFNVRRMPYYVGSAFAKSFSSDKNKEIFAPLANYNQNKQEHLKDTIKNANNTIAKNVEQLALNKAEKREQAHDKMISNKHVDEYFNRSKEHQAEISI